MNPLHRITRSLSYRTGRLVNLCHPRRWKRYDRPRAVFMTGMPRSGTSLAKRYLGSHPGIVMAPAATYHDSWEFAGTAPPDKIVLIKLGQEMRKNSFAMKRAIDSFKLTCGTRNGRVAGLDDRWLILLPNGVHIEN